MTEDESQAVDLLISKGVWANVAQDLIRSHGPGICRHQAECLPFPKGVEDPPAWLRWAIETGHPLPNQLRPRPSLIDENESASRPIPLLSINGSDGASRHHEDSDPVPSSAARQLEDNVRRRRDTGEFEGAIRAFETASLEQYTKHVATSIPVQADDTENRYYVSLDGDLYLCLDRSTDEEHLVRICTLDRAP